MSRNVSNSFFDKRDIILLAVCLFVVVLIITVYDAYQRGKVDAEKVTLDAPPVVKVDVDLSIFNKLRGMTE